MKSESKIHRLMETYVCLVFAEVSQNNSLCAGCAISGNLQNVKENI